MQNLINALNSGSPEYRDNGDVITRPPTATMIRAAKVLAQLANINEQNAQIIMQQQNTINQQLQEIENLKNAAVHSMSETPQPADNMGGASTVDRGSDSNSQTNSENK